MPPIQHFAAPAGIKAPPLSFAARVGDLRFVSGIPGFDDKGCATGRRSYIRNQHIAALMRVTKQGHPDHC
jgi:hypothetical protein